MAKVNDHTNSETNKQTDNTNSRVISQLKPNVDYLMYGCHP